jgi:hypothetical protein
MKPIESSPSGRARRWCRPAGCRPIARRRRPRRFGQAVQPDQRFLDFVGLEADRRQLARQLVVVGAGVRAPVVLVEIDQHFEHRTTIPQRKPALCNPARRPAPCAARAGAQVWCRPQAPWRRWYRPPGRRATRPSSSRSAAGPDKVVRWPAGAGDQGVERDRVVAQRGQHRVGLVGAAAVPVAPLRCARAAAPAGAVRRAMSARAFRPAWRPGGSARGSRGLRRHGSTPGWRTPRARPPTPAGR